MELLRETGSGESTRQAVSKTASTPPVDELPRKGRLLACLDDSTTSQAIIEQALAIANALDFSVAAARVLESPHHPAAPADPLEWQVRRRDSLSRLDHVLKMAARGRLAIERILLAGPAANELTDWAGDNGATLMALGTSERETSEFGLGSTARQVLERATASLLLVPKMSKGRLPYRRLLLPLDGSCRAESVLPVAIRLARAYRAEIVLAHVVSPLEAIGVGPSEAATHDLCHRLANYNEQCARDYLDTLEARLWKERLPVRVVISTDGDPRTELRRLALELQADIIIVSAHGRNGMPDVPCGKVTDYLATHAPVPLLIVRPNFEHVFAENAPLPRDGARSASTERA